MSFSSATDRRTIASSSVTPATELKRFPYRKVFAWEGVREGEEREERRDRGRGIGREMEKRQTVRERVFSGRQPTKKKKLSFSVFFF